MTDSVLELYKQHCVDIEIIHQIVSTNRKF